MKLHWEHHPETHEDYTVDCPWGVYYKLQAYPDDVGCCSGGKANWYGYNCGRPWGGQRRGLYWCRIVYSDGREEWLTAPSESKAKPYEAFLAHKKRVLSAGAADWDSRPAPPRKSAGGDSPGPSEPLGDQNELRSVESHDQPVRRRPAPSSRRYVHAQENALIKIPIGAPFDDELFERIRLAVEVGDEVATLSSLKLNEIFAVDRDGIDVSTERSRRRGTGPQRVPAWMFMRAWHHLCSHGSLTQQGLLDDLGVKRSAFVCALLATFPDVEVDKRSRTALRLNFV